MAFSRAFITYPLFFCLLLGNTLCESERTPQTNALVLPVSKHSLTGQYVTRIRQGTPLVPVDIVLHLEGPFLWISYDHPSQNSSSYQSASCQSAQCSLAEASSGCSKRCISRSGPLCSSNDTCMIFSRNVFTTEISPGELSKDVLSLQATDGLIPTSMVSVPEFMFLSAPEYLAEGLAGGARGIAGLGRSQIGLPMQLASAFNLAQKFAVCLSSSPDTNGVIFFGDGPYVLLPGIDISKILIYTPLVTESSSRGAKYQLGDGSLHSHDKYHITVKSVRVNGRRVPLNTSLLLINDKGIGGTKISTAVAYTTMHTSIYESLTKAFLEETSKANISRVAAVAPFEICFSLRNTGNTTGVGRPAMPVVDLILHNEKVFWRIFETNLMVVVKDDTTCLGVLNGGLQPQTSIVIGGHQLEDNFLQFDLQSSRLGFTSSLLLRQTDCASFNFTPTSS